jgi:lipopolysaccharide export system permease protein
LRTTLNSNRLRKNDYAAKERKYLVEIYKKHSIPFAVSVFLMVGCPLGVAARKGNFGVSAGISLGFFIFYWAFLIGGEKLADRGFLPPGLSMWLGNIIIGMISVYLTIKVNNESITMPGAKYVRGLLKKHRANKEEAMIISD